MDSYCFFVWSFLILGCSLFANSEQHSSDPFAFEIFLKLSLQEFPTWISTNNLVPGKPNHLEYDLSINNSRFDLNCKIRDEHVDRYPSFINPWYNFNASVDIERGIMDISYYTNGQISIWGNYSANGSLVASGFPLAGDGEYFFTMFDRVVENLRYEFRITSQGYVVISGDSLSNYNLVRVTPYLTSLDFFGLWDFSEDDFAIDLQRDLINKYFARVRTWYPEHPTSSMLHKYFIEVFQNTTLEEIMATTPPPEITTEATSDEPSTWPSDWTTTK